MLQRNSAAVAMALAFPAAAQAAPDADLAAIRSQIQEMKQSYEQRIAALEAQLARAENKADRAAASAGEAQAAAQAATVQAAQRPASAAAFNPEISLILSGNYANLSGDPAQRRLQGFLPANGEKMPARRSFNLGESELALSANVDHLFRGDVRLAIAPDDTLGVEEASIQTLGLGEGLNLKAGRFLSGIGYLNAQHPHEWDFSDAPLPYQAFFGNALGMDGIQGRWLAPTPFYLEVGAETARARSFPSTDAGRDKNGLMSAATFVHLGGDIGLEQSWRGGLSYFFSRPRERDYDDPLNGLSNAFNGQSRTWIADFLWKWAPNGNGQVTNLKLQGEYLHRSERGDLTYDRVGATPSAGAMGGYRSVQSGYYAQAVFQFLPGWRVGYRYDRLNPGSRAIDLVNNGTLTLADLPLLERYAPRRQTLMADWSPSEFSRIRLQFAADQTRPETTDHQVWLQYIMSLGTHGAHKF